ncbi:hypothetical protein GUP02_002847 [Salmonella enterica]|nr:hypothetical protein [Salmonella enterica]EGE5319035.1 hypothetical protein [Salmonella enterica subsp. enterica serovar Anatum]
MIIINFFVRSGTISVSPTCVYGLCYHMQILNKLLEMLQSEFSYNEREVQWGSEYYAKKKEPPNGSSFWFFYDAIVKKPHIALRERIRQYKFILQLR